MIQQTVDGVSFCMAQAHDFSFLARFGRVFRVLDGQDSGNLCFGLAGERGRLFLKFAGAQTARAGVSPEDAVENLRAAARVARDLAHPRLLPLLWAGEIGGGYAAVRPKKKTFTRDGGSGKPYAVGYVTNSIENGHKQEKGRYVPALGKKLVADRVAGKGAYLAARQRAEEIAYQAAERFAKKIQAKLQEG